MTAVSLILRTAVRMPPSKGHVGQILHTPSFRKDKIWGVGGLPYFPFSKLSLCIWGFKCTFYILPVSYVSNSKFVSFVFHEQRARLTWNHIHIESKAWQTERHYRFLIRLSKMLIFTAQATSIFVLCKQNVLSGTSPAFLMNLKHYCITVKNKAGYCHMPSLS